VRGRGVPTRRCEVARAGGRDLGDRAPAPAAVSARVRAWGTRGRSGVGRVVASTLCRDPDLYPLGQRLGVHGESGD